MANLYNLNNSPEGQVRVKIIFFHGLLGSAEKTWLSEDQNDPYWPLWLCADIPDVRVAAISYNTNISDWISTSMPREDIAASLAPILAADRECISVPLILIGHSLGGLIIKQVIRRIEVLAGRDPIYRSVLHNIKLVIFLGTPQFGSRIASLGVRFRALINTSPLTQSLEADNPGLRDLNDWYRTYAAGKIDHLVLSEGKPTKWLGMVVGSSSSDPGVDNALATPIDVDHTNICKPTNREHQIYVLIKNKICSTLTSLSEPSRPDTASSTDGSPNAKRERRSFASRIATHKSVAANEAEQKPFVVLLCAPSVTTDASSASAKLGARIRDALIADEFEVVLGEDDGIGDPRIVSTGNSALDEFNFVEGKCNAVVVVADSIGTYCELGILSWNLANGPRFKKKGIDIIVIVDSKHSTSSAFFRNGAYAIIEGAGKADFAAFEEYDVNLIVDRLRSRRSFYTIDKRGSRRGASK
ncbi:hypothetical protein E4V01_25205 [Methylorubrum sp. Q1]|uniref:esterase/lipase family protein n=1 Tax=Methylorubrum sp. Q1 TaxID=2562453 RepID=UPI0010765945|nr:hypothetical protein [Methylorubrum sp. Q1]TFZ54444.1 hypothetical protein E4V01_25205 [Methylorubrum sp. Q1]